MPGYQWSCCKSFVFDAVGFEAGDGRYDEKALYEQCKKIRGCKGRKHDDGSGVKVAEELQACLARKKILSRHLTV